jgi:hypothetical protein
VTKEAGSIVQNWERGKEGNQMKASGTLFVLGCVVAGLAELTAVATGTLAPAVLPALMSLGLFIGSAADRVAEAIDGSAKK